MTFWSLYNFLKTDFGISYKLPANDLTISECLNQENIYLFYLSYFYILFYFYLFIFYFIFILFLFIIIIIIIIIIAYF